MAVCRLLLVDSIQKMSFFKILEVCKVFGRRLHFSVSRATLTRLLTHLHKIDDF